MYIRTLLITPIMFGFPLLMIDMNLEMAEKEYLDSLLCGIQECTMRVSFLVSIVWMRESISLMRGERFQLMKYRL